MSDLRTTGGMQQEMLMRRNTMRTAASNSEQHAWAGGLAGFVAGLMLYPAETVSMRCKVGGRSAFARPRRAYPRAASGVLRHIVESEGLLALWSGTPASMIGTIPSSAIYFVAYEAMKAHGEARVREGLHPLVHMTAGGLSELLSSVVYVPFEVVKARMQLGKDPHLATNGALHARTNYANSLVAIASIARTEGARGLYAGFAPCLATDMSFRGMQFLLYELGKKRLVEAQVDGKGTSTTDDLLLGFAAGALAAFVSNPFDVITVQLMVRGLDESSDARAALKRVLANIRRDGTGILFRGALYRVAALAPHSAITFAVFQWSLKMLG